MRFRVLGDLGVDAAPGPVPVGGPVPRRVLTALLVTPGEVVPTGALVAAAWGDQAPPSAERSLHSHITRLRDALGSADASVGVERRDGGYRLTVSPDDVDAERFCALARRAQVLPPTEALPHLLEAEALWRPRPYADLVDTAYPHADAARLIELHGAVRDSLVSARLGAGDAVGAAVDAEAWLRDDPYRERLWELLVLALYRQGRQGDALAAYQRARRALLDGLGVEPGPGLSQLEARVLAQDPTLLAAVPMGRPPCPYKGLARYDAADSELFVGRERLVDELVGRLVDRFLVVVVGPSGAGKSSLVRAGLVPALAAGAIPGSSSWTVLVIVPGADPSGALRDALARGPELVVVDQAEEALLADEGAHLRDVADQLLAAQAAGTRVLLALRADFYGRLAEHPQLSRRAGPATVLVGPPDDDELRRIVVEPAHRVGLRVDPDLADLVVTDVRGRPGALPVLSTALVRAWEHREGDTLTVASYRAGGGVEAALQRAGDEAWAALDDDDQRAACRRILLRLAVEEDGQWVRRRARRSEVAADGDASSVAALDALTSRRLVVSRADDIEIAHEALLTGWPLLLGWLEESRSRADVLAHLAAASSTWQAGGQDPGELYRGTRLQAALDTASAAPQDLTATEQAFLDASGREAERALDDERRRADREARGRRRSIGVAIGLAVALVAATVAGGLAVRQQRQAEAATLTADAARLGTLARTGADYNLSLLEAAQAVKLSPSLASDSDLFATLVRGGPVVSTGTVPPGVEFLAYSHDGATRYGTSLTDLYIWPPGRPATQVHLGDGDVRGLAVLPDGHLLVGAAKGPAVVSETTGAILSQGPGSPGWWAVSADGRWLIGRATDVLSDVVVWQVGTPASSAVTVPVGGEVHWINACGDAACVLEADGVLRRVGFRDGRILSTVRTAAEMTYFFAASRDGRSVAVRTPEGVVDVLDPRSGTVRQRLAGGSRSVVPLAFSADGTKLVTADYDLVLLWHVGTDDPPERLVGHANRVGDAAFSPDGSSLTTSANDGSLITWDVTGSRHVVALVNPRPLPANPAGLAAAAGTAVMTDESSRVMFVDAPTGVAQPVTVASPHPPGPLVGTVSISADGSRSVTTDEKGTTALWDQRQHALIGLLDVPAPVCTGPDTWVSPDGRLAATIRSGAGPLLVDLRTRRVARRLAALPGGGASCDTRVQGWTADGRGILVSRSVDGHGEVLVVSAEDGSVLVRGTTPLPVVTEVVADPLGRFLAVGTEDGSQQGGWVAFLDAHDGHPLATPQRVVTYGSTRVSMSDDGRWLLTSGDPGELQLWDAASLTRVGPVLSVDPDNPAIARFAADGTVLVASGPSLFSISIDPARWLQRACAEAGRILTPQEWAGLLPDRPYDPACTSPSHE